MKSKCQQLRELLASGWIVRIMGAHDGLGAKLVEQQEKLLERAASLTAPGGLLIYCTCSLEPQEGERQIEKFLATHPDFARAPLSPDDLPGLPEAITAKGDMRTLPTFWADRGGMDGFYMAELIKAEH